jgi:hypothetical protein
MIRCDKLFVVCTTLSYCPASISTLQAALRCSSRSQSRRCLLCGPGIARKHHARLTIMPSLASGRQPDGGSTTSSPTNSSRIVAYNALLRVFCSDGVIAIRLDCVNACFEIPRAAISVEDELTHAALRRYSSSYWLPRAYFVRKHEAIERSLHYCFSSPYSFCSRFVVCLNTTAAPTYHESVHRSARASTGRDRTENSIEAP